MIKKVLVIGGNRFFGRHLVQALIEKGIKPVLFNRQNIDDAFGNKVERVKGNRDLIDDLHKIATSQNWDFVFDQVCFNSTHSELAAAHFKKKT